MKRIFIVIMSVVIVASSCAKQPATIKNDDAKRYFNAWMSVNHPNLIAGHEDHIGAYIVKDEEITSGKRPKHGQVVGDSTYLFMTMTARSLDGTITSTNDVVMGKQLGSYSKYQYWGAGCYYINEGVVYKGVEDVLKGVNVVADKDKTYEGAMKVGYKRTAIIPGWLRSLNRYSTLKDYLSQVEGDNEIYEILIHDYTNNIKKWQLDTMAKSSAWKYITRGIPEAKDTVKAGLYFATLAIGKDTVSLPKDTTIYVNYIARLLDGTIFDTNIPDSTLMISPVMLSVSPMGVTTAEQFKDWKIASSSESSTSDSSSSLITGFCEIISRMHKYEKAAGMFTSDFGYGASSSSGKFPSYSPMIFEIELVDKP